jgi:hypothetical protein
MRSDDDNPSLRSPSFFRTQSELAQERAFAELQASLPKVYSWDQFEGLPVEHPREIIPGFLDAGQIMVGGGSSKAGKTFLALQLGICIASGVSFLDAFKPQPITVLYVGFELSDYRLKQRITSISKRLGAKPGKNLFTWNLRRKYLDLMIFAQLLTLKIAETGALLVIIDPLYTLLGTRDENRVTDMTDLLVQLAKVQDQTKGIIALIIMHHFPKGNHASKSLLDCFSGSGAIGRFVDSAFGIRDHKTSQAGAKSYVLDFELRDHPEIPGFVVDLEFPLFIRNDQKDASAYKEQGGRPTEFTADALLEHLRDNDDSFSSTSAWFRAAAEDIHIGRTSFYQLFNQLRDSKRIFRSKASGNWNVAATKD